jgi:superfamily II DNA or RNA helicase
MRLRPYQHECLTRIHEHFVQHDSTLVEMATGTGKTVIFCHLAKDWPSGRVLIVAHRE